MNIDRRLLLNCAALSPLLPMAQAWAATMADYMVKIAEGLVELAADQIVSTTLYNNQFPGPLLRSKESQRALPSMSLTIPTPPQRQWFL